MPFLLAFFGHEAAESLGIAWVTEVFAVIIVYCCKSYFETKQEKKQKLENFMNGMEGDNGGDPEISGRASDCSGDYYSHEVSDSVDQEQD